MATKKTAADKRTTTVGVYQTHDEAARAVAELKRSGFTDQQVSLVGKDGRGKVKTEGNMAAEGAATGAAVGAGAAALASLGMTFGIIPVIGPILAVGPLAAALISAAGGAAAASLAGGLIGMGIPEEEAQYYEGEVKAGRYVVAVNSPDRYQEAWSVLHSTGAYNHETAATARTAATGQQTVQVHEEELHARKQPVQTGEVRVRKDVITEHRTMDVPVTREEVVIERHPASGKTVPGASIRAGEEIRIPVREEQVHVEKTNVVKEEVSIGKRQVQGTEHVDGTVRKEEVRVETEGNVEVHDERTRRNKK